MPKNDAPAATKKSGGSGNNEQALNTKDSSVPSGTNMPGQEATLTLDIASSTGSTLNDGGTNIEQQAVASPAGADAGSLLDHGAVDQGLIDAMPSRVPAIEVTATRDGFRRAGRAWSKAPTIVLMSDLSEELWELLVDEPNLSIRGIYVAPEADGE